ncbi:hypothetical protein B0H17DRAFT_1185704 [Mycena rosella]|uniref:Uncharacterized protein n=1 Tax=Mycena rosella TaxID=1033263 RepID=A0AAD7CQH6_MYCRO|nr:hypothetical protein B0H17DRAFT_1185704 [Mycena rosella]
MSRLSVDWNDFSGTYLLLGFKAYGVEIGALILRLYFGVVGCIVPIVCAPEFDNDIFVFTLAGPCDTDGKKEFYIMMHDQYLKATQLLRCSPGFSSVVNFHLHRPPADDWTPVLPVDGGEEATVSAFLKCGYRQQYEEVEWDSSDWE